MVENQERSINASENIFEQNGRLGRPSKLSADFLLRVDAFYFRMCVCSAQISQHF
jgi:hypothetical protein